MPGPVNLGTPGTERSTSEPPRELRVLLVEDSALLRVRLSAMLDVPGVMKVVSGAETEDEAKREIAQQDFDVLLVDVELRHGSGIGVIRHARSTYAGRHHPLVIVLTNYALPTVEQRCMNAGADFFLDKMREFEEVRPIIERWRGAERH
jgi:CheY-like chemotaxis protein